MGNSVESSLLFDQPGPKGLKRIRIINWVATILFVVVLVLIVLRLHNPPDGENQLSWELWKPCLLYTSPARVCAAPRRSAGRRCQSQAEQMCPRLGTR